MGAIEAIDRIVANEHLVSWPFKWCLVSKQKVPYTYQGELAKPNDESDFCDLFKLTECESLGSYEGVGISVRASGITAIDIDKCFSVPFDVSSGDDRARRALELFSGKAYIEFSFSGSGIRILFSCPEIEGYSEKYYTKNERHKIEFYQPSGSARYVTVTGLAISDAGLCEMNDMSVVSSFLEEYMRKPERSLSDGAATERADDRPIEELLAIAKHLYLTDIEFQDMWFARAPGSNSNESQMDWHLLALIVKNVTTDRAKAKQVFEASPYFKSKDWKHLNKWNYGNGRYFNFIFSKMVLGKD